MKVKLVFDDWKKKGKGRLSRTSYVDIYTTEKDGKLDAGLN